jgi:transposase
MKHMEAQVKQVDVLPMVKYHMQELDLYNLLKKYVPKAEQCPIEPAQVLCMLTANIICASNPLYQVGEWLTNYMDGAGEEPLNGSFYNDDRLGRCVDKLFEADRHSLMMELSASAIKVHALETKQIHNDSTSITLSGEYEQPAPEAVQLMRGFNKDYRPDCKQIVFGLNITEDGNVPLSFNLFDGNRTDDTTHVPNWEGLRSLLGKDDFIYIADCKMCSDDNLEHIAGNGGKFITIMPKNRKEVKDFYKQIIKQDMEWQDAYTIKNPRNREEVIVYKTYEGTQTKEGYRLVWIHSNAKEAQDRKRREHKIKNAIEKLEELNPKLNKYYLKTKAQIEAAIKKICNSVGEFVRTEVIEEKESVRVQTTPGKPGPKTRYEERETIRYRIGWALNKQAILDESKTDGLFPLTTNIDDNGLEAKEVLRKYKHQPYLEKRFYTAKSILEIAPVFLKLPRRIEAMMFLYFAALMIVTLLEREIRKNMAAENIEKLPILPQGMNTKTPTWNNIRYFFRSVSLVSITVSDKVIKTIVKGITTLHCKVMQLLKVPDYIYECLNENWWEFDSG